MPKKKGLTPKQAKFVQGIADGKPAYKAALDAYDAADMNSASTIAAENLQKLTVKEALEPILAKHEINLDTAIAPIGKGLKAIKQNEFTGEKTEDLQTQLKASDRALKLLGIGVDKTPQGNTFVQVNNYKADKYSG